MPNRSDYLSLLKIDDEQLRRRRAFFELTDQDLVRLASLRPLAEKYTDGVVEDFYRLLLGHGDTRRFFTDDATLRRVKAAQRDYFLGLFAGKCDLAYVENRLRVGAAHEKIGMEPRWYLGAYRRYLELLIDRITRDIPDREESRKGYEALQRLVFFDMSLAIDTYIAANLETIGRHQAAIRELSTPVIRIFDRVLLLPLIGAVDSLRAYQVMESVLTRVVEEQAKVIILDIAGVPVVDTKVADNLVKTTGAVRLLGAETILTGISAQVARTIVQLGVDISTMHTLSNLAEGIELALSLMGRTIAPKASV